MKVGFLVQDTGVIYGAEQATLDLAAGLSASADYEVTWLVIEEERLALPSSAFREAMGEDRVRIAVRGRFSRTLVRAVRDAVRTRGIDVLHSIGPKANLHGGLASRWGRDVPLVATVHGWLRRVNVKEWCYTQLEKAVFRRCSAVVVLSLYYEKMLLGIGVARDRLHRIPSGFDAEALASRADAEASWPDASPFTVGVLARFTEEKNHPLLVEGAARLRDEGVDVRWVFAGDGPERERIAALVSRRGLDDVVALPGLMARDDFFRRVHGLVLASRLENLPYSILEAMAWCRPVVATAVGGIPDLVIPGETGALVPAGDASELAAAVRSLAENPDRARAMGLAGRARVEREFSADTCVERHRALYAALGHRAGGDA